MQPFPDMRIMAGQYVKGKEIADPFWQQFLEDVKAGEMEVAGGVTAAEYGNMAVRADGFGLASISFQQRMRKQVARALKGYRISDGAEHEAVTELLKAHGEFCKATGAVKWKRIHNVLAYRYADSNILTNRMIARKLGKCKEEIDNDLMQGQQDIVILCCGYAAIADYGADAYDITDKIIHKYKLLSAADMIDVSGIFSDEIGEVVRKCKAESNQLMKCFRTAARLYEAYCRGYGAVEMRRLDSLEARFTKGNSSAPEMAKKHFVSLSTIQNDHRMNVKRLSEIMFI